MKKILLLCFAAMMAVSVIAVNNKQIIGVWKEVNDHSGTPTESYFGFMQDGTYVHAQPIKDQGIITFHIGSYEFRNNTLYVSHDLRYRILTDYNNIPRVVLAVGMKREGPNSVRIESVDEHRLISRNADDTLVEMHRQDTLPFWWNPVFFEQETEWEEKDIIGKWNLLNFFTFSGEKYNYVFCENPSSDGVLFHSAHYVLYDFFSLWLTQTYRNKGELANDARMEAYQEDCRWVLKNKALTLSCPKYAIVQMDSVGQSHHLRTIQPEQPLTETFKIMSCTKSLLILRSLSNDIYIAFAR